MTSGESMHMPGLRSSKDISMGASDVAHFELLRKLTSSVPVSCIQVAFVSRSPELSVMATYLLQGLCLRVEGAGFRV